MRLKFIPSLLLFLLLSLFVFKSLSDNHIGNCQLTKSSLDVNDNESNEAIKPQQTDLNRYESEIQKFEVQDLKQFPPKDAVLFVGSSSIRLWKSLKNDFPEFDVINRGFGGAVTAEVLYYFDRIVTPYAPSSIVFFAGTNDLAGGISPSVVLANTETFIKKVNTLFPDTKIIILSNTIAPVRKQFYKSYHEANRLLVEMIDQYEFVQFLDVTTPGLKPDGWPRSDIYTVDSLHLNDKGYKMWSTNLRPLLLKVESK